MSFAITLGTHDTSSLRRALADAGVRQNVYASRLFDEGHVVPGPARIVHVVVKSAAEQPRRAGWRHPRRDDRACAARGSGSGPLELAAYLRLAWRDQPRGPRVTVVSLRPTPEETSPRGFYLRHDDEGLWLRGYVASDDWVFEPTEGLAFVRT